jgi:threonine synthase
MRADAAALFASARIDADSMDLAMRLANERSGMLLDPHTAIGLAAAQAANLPGDVPVVTLATAHPAKFPDAVERATGMRPPLPRRVGDLFDRAERYDVLPGDLATVQAYIAERATAA